MIVIKLAPDSPHSVSPSFLLLNISYFQCFLDDGSDNFTSVLDNVGYACKYKVTRGPVALRPIARTK